jgi:4a-hydroxytetrahydrobiopterin dehydratase
MHTLADEKVILSKKGGPAISKEEIESLLSQIRGWTLLNEDCDKLTKAYSLPDYETAVALTRKIAAIAQQVNHHPAIVLEWGKVTVTWWTHVIGGLHKNDFILAAKCDRVAMLVTAP